MQAGGIRVLGDYSRAWGGFVERNLRPVISIACLE
jgi:hypothetical protein